MLSSSIRSRMIRNVSLVALPAMLLVASFVAQSRADEIDRSAVNRARTFVETEKRGKFILSYLHFGSAYTGHDLKRVTAVSDGAGAALPGQFCLIYEFDWDGTGWTELALFFDAKGGFNGLKALSHNANFNVPFLKADLTIAVLGSALKEIYRDQMTESQLRDVQRAIDNASSKDLLSAALALQQGLGL